MASSLATMVLSPRDRTSFTLSIACYDLYKNFPLLRNFLDTYFKETHEWLEDLLQQKFAALMATLLYVAWPLQFVYETLAQSAMLELAVQAMNGCLTPFVYLGTQAWSLLKLLFDLLWPIKALLSFILRSSWLVIWNILCLPYTIVSLLYGGCYNLVELAQSFRGSVSTVTTIAERAPSTADT